MINTQDHIIIIQQIDQSKSIPTLMIDYTYNQRNEYTQTPLLIFLSFLVFITLTAFFFLTFMNICFDTIVSDPPLWILVAFYAVLACDLAAQVYFLKTVGIKFGVNFVVLVLLVLSWAVKNQVAVFLSALVFVRFPEIIKYNDIVQDKLRSRPTIFKFYTLLKILYLFSVIGHILGCIFYAIDNTLIKMQYFGPIADNPSLYYQGTLLCYSPIYSLSEINRYLYAMYYIFSLLATVAYGDIIPKNMFENAYVCFLLVLSTVSISFVIEQLLIVLNDSWELIYEIMRRVKFLDSMLEQSIVTSQTRLKIISFMLYSLKHQARNYPDIGRLTNTLQLKLIGETIGLKKITHNLMTLQGQNKISNLKIYEQYSLPFFLAQFLLKHLTLVYFPGNYLFIDNTKPWQSNSLSQPIALFLTLGGQIKLSYGSQRAHLKKVISIKNKLLCWREFIWANRNLNPQFRVETKQLCEFYTISVVQLRDLMKKERVRVMGQEWMERIGEYYQVARDDELLQIYDDKQQYERQVKKYLKDKQESEAFGESQSISLPAMTTQQINNLYKYQQQKVGEQVSSHILRCWSCGKRTHTPATCPHLHYIPILSQILKKQKYSRKCPFDETCKNFKRSSIKSRKLKNIRNFSNEQMDNKRKEKVRFESYINRKNQELKSLKNAYYGLKPFIFEKYEKYQNFNYRFNLKGNAMGDGHS